MRRAKRHNTPLAMAFVDIEKAYDSIDRAMLFKLLLAYGVDPDCVKLIQAMYTKSSAYVTTPAGDSEPFDIDTGVRQGCLLSCLLFDVVMDAITRRFLAECKEGGVSADATEFIRCLLYADDVVLFAHNTEDIQTMLTCWDRISMEYGLVTSVKKTKIMFVAPGEGFVAPDFAIRTQPVEVVPTFRYLGVTLSEDSKMDTEVGARVASAHAAWNKYKNTVFLNKHLSLRTRVMMFKVTIVTALLYGAEAWAPTQKHVQRLTVTYNTFLRSMLSIKWWDRRSTTEVLSIARLPPFARYVASRTLRWQGHVARMPLGRFPPLVVDDTTAFRSLPVGVTKGKTVPKLSSWKGQCTNAADIAISMYPFRKVPHPADIIQDRDKWRMFTAPTDSGTSWDDKRRNAYLHALRHETTVEETEDKTPRRSLAKRPGTRQAVLE